MYFSTFSRERCTFGQPNATAGWQIEFKSQLNGLQAVYFVPFFNIPQSDSTNSLDFSAYSSLIDGALNWMAWQNNGANKAPSNGNLVTVNQGDQAYLNALNGKAYIARESQLSFPAIPVLTRTFLQRCPRE